jgi:hypothetical protein
MIMGTIFTVALDHDAAALARRIWRGRVFEDRLTSGHRSIHGLIPMGSFGWS